MCAGAEIVQDHLTGLKEFVLDQLKPEEPKPAEETATDGMVMASRDGLTFFTWQGSFIRPGPRRIGSWFYGDHHPNWGVLETPAILEKGHRTNSRSTSPNTPTIKPIPPICVATQSAPAANCSPSH